MVYLDYSATTPVNDEVLSVFTKVSKEYIGNPNSIHRLGLDSKKLMEEASLQIKKLLNVNHEVVFTSSGTESNNLALFGVSNFYKNRNKIIITTKLEHSSTKSSLEQLERKGYSISYVNLLDNGLVDLEHLETLLKLEPVLVSISLVDSELGIVQNLDSIKKLVNNYSLTLLHVDATQSVGKIDCDFNDVDLVTFSAHKFYGLKGIGCLLKNPKVCLEPIIYGGKSQSDYRSGTPALALIVSTVRALRLSLDNSLSKYNYVLELSSFLKNELLKFSNVVVNSTSKSLPHIINISLVGIKPETMIHALEEDNIFISTKSACSKSINISDSVLEITKDKLLASSSLRISLSYLTTKQEIIKFLNIFEKKLIELNFLKGEY